MPEAVALLERLADRGWTIGIAESLTGGLLAAALVEVPGASVSLRGAVVAYATELKHTVLGVDAQLLAEHGPVHAEVARQMATGVRAVVGHDGVPADVGIATTGIAGPTSPDGQPVGTVHIGVSTPAGTHAVALQLRGDRDRIRRDAVAAALSAALEVIR
ncbi:CinA family protein [Microbacterium kribbense]|uniref:CinA family protein n=1 Tax=Microbacterium kribbense TaxID=433645 RepID=UPI003CD0698C